MNDKKVVFGRVQINIIIIALNEDINRTADQGVALPKGIVYYFD